jgi:hypothetical protein
MPNKPAPPSPEQLVDDLASAFLRWPLPDSVAADLCTMKPQPGRIGTNLLSYVEAREMFRALVLPALKAERANAAQWEEKYLDALACNSDRP